MAIYIPFCRDLYLSSNSLSKLFEISITISSILFGVLGIWVSTVYSESLTAFTTGTKDEKNEAIGNLEILIIPLLFSLFCILIGVFFFIFKSQLIENFKLFYEFKVVLLKFSFTVYCITTFIQFWYLASIFKPILSLSFKMEKDKIKNNIKEEHFKPRK